MLRVVPWKYVIFTAWMICEIVQAQSIPKTSFSCDGRTSGYYADVATDCQVYHMCDGLGRQFSYKCPSKTLFQQRMLICDHWYMVNCSKAEEDYSANLLIGQREKAFIEDLDYHRTPRPDLVDPGNSDYNTYRIGQQEVQSIRNVVESTTISNTYKREESDTATPGSVKQVFYRTSYNTVNKGLNSNVQPKGKGIDFNSVNRNGNTFNANPSLISTKDNSNIGDSFLKQQITPNQIAAIQDDQNVQNQENDYPGQVNFPSRFKATTPVYPKHVDADLSKFFEFGNPLEQNQQEDEVSINFPSNFKATTPVYPNQVAIDPSKISEFDIPFEQKPIETVSVNFPSNFQATTPVYPTHVETDPSKLSEFDILSNDQEKAEIVSVNFPSLFRATTPVYPEHVDVDLSKFSEFEELSPRQNSGSEDVVVNFASNFKATTPMYPKQVDVDLAKFLEPVELPREDESGKNGSVNFASDFKATTPVYPQTVDPTSPKPDEAGLLPPLPSSELQNDVNSAENKVHVNFASNFQATTPNYPTSVEPTSPDPNEVGLVVPQLNADEQDPDIPSLDIQPPNFHQTFSRRSDEYDPTVVGNTFNSKQLTEFMITMKPEQLRNLKELWHIPDYDFPLETASRPSYSSDLSSFQTKPVNKR